MKRAIKVVLSALILSSATLKADNGEYLEAAVDEMNQLYVVGPGCGCEDGIYNAVSSSMIGWGIGLVAGIAILTGLIHHSHSNSTPSNNTSN